MIFDVGLVLVEFNWQAYLDSFGFDKEKRDTYREGDLPEPGLG